MCNDKEILQQVKIALIKTLDLPSCDDLDANANLREKYGLDSMSSLTFLMTLEDMIPGFVIDSETLDTEYLETLSGVAKYVEQELNK